MKLSRKVALIVLPLAAVLAGCNSMKTGTESSPGTTAQTPAAKGTAVDVFLASDKVIKSYRPVKLSEKQTIYVSKTPIITRANLTSVDRVRDSQGRSFVKLSLNPAGVAALNAAPKEQGYATTVGGQLLPSRVFARITISSSWSGMIRLPDPLSRPSRQKQQLNNFSCLHCHLFCKWQYQPRLVARLFYDL